MKSDVTLCQVVHAVKVLLCRKDLNRSPTAVGGIATRLIELLTASLAQSILTDVVPAGVWIQESLSWSQNTFY
jgi:hypothetical protein